MSPRGLAGLAGAILFLLVPSRAFAGKKCVEVSDTVGLQHCRRFGGEWALEGEPPLVFNFGMRYSEVGTGHTSFSENLGKESRPDGYQRYRYSGESLGVQSLGGAGIEGGVELFIWRQLYVGFQGAFVFGAARLASFQASNGAQLSGDSGVNVMTMTGALPIGFRVALGRVSLRPEIDFGWEDITVNHVITGGPPGTPDGGSASATKGLIEPRLTADMWFTQHLSVGGYAAINVLDADGRGRAFGLNLTFHIRSFDGDTSF